MPARATSLLEELDGGAAPKLLLVKGAIHNSGRLDLKRFPPLVGGCAGRGHLVTRGRFLSGRLW